MNKLNIGDIIIITDDRTINYLVVGRVIEVYSAEANRRQTVTSKEPYRVEFSLPHTMTEFSSCNWATETRYYDKTLPDKCKILFKEKGEN